MNNLSTESTAAVAISALGIFLSIFLLISRNGQKRTLKNKQQAPVAGGAWPLIGHLHLLRGPEPAHRVLGRPAKALSFVWGVKQALVVSNWEIAKECFTTNDKAFAGRPKTMAVELMGYNFLVIGFAPYGNYWRQSRKIVTIELLSNRRLEKLKHVRESEVKASIQRLYKNCISSSSSRKVVSVEMIHWLEGTALDIILRIIAGKRHTSQSEEANDWQQQITKIAALFGQFVVSDALPFLRRLDIGGYERLMSKTAKYFDIILQEWVDEHKMKRVSGEIKGDEDFIYVLLSLLDDNAEQLPDRDADTVIKAICLTLIVAATDTTAVTLTWAIALLLNNPDVLKKAQDELDIQVGTERQVNESDEEFGLLAGHYQGNNAFIPCWTTFTTSRVYRRMHRKGLWLTGGSMSPYGRALFMMLHTSQKLNSAEKWDGLLVIFLTSLDGKPCKDEFSSPRDHDEHHAKGGIRSKQVTHCFQFNQDKLSHGSMHQDRQGTAGLPENIG
ncbi:Xanthotoxin 5-hydroxylase CYP82C4 [Citrus sinensis]|nr:Xanthotoxin 5-hydroxylase CYP82C4 [Citrus sinensis]